MSDGLGRSRPQSSQPRRSWRYAWLLVALFALALGAQAKEVPFLAGRVNDLAGLLSPDVEARVEQSLEALEKATGTQVVVLTVVSLEGEPLEDYTLRVAETWKLGRGDLDDGALFFIARDDRKLRLEVGYGLEATLPDLKSRRILDEIVLPRFRSGDFGGGIEAGVETIAGVVSGESDLPPPSRGPRGGDRSAPIFFLVIATFVIQALGGAPKRIAWILFLVGAPLGWVLISFFFGSAAALFFLLAWLILFPVLRFLASRRPPGSSGHRRGPFGGAILGSGGGWSSGGFSGGGFSGGGGSFGGGGASSSW